MRLDARLLWPLLCLLAAAMPWLAPPPAPTGPSDFPGWPKSYAGQPLQALPLSPLEARFAENFPGQIGRFSDGRREIILRWVRSETRKLHPAADCFRGSGYQVEALPLRRSPDGEQWGRFRASRGKESILVEERIVDAHGQQWSDVSAWYWAALWAHTTGPWWAITVARTEDSDEAGDGRQKDLGDDHRLRPQPMARAARP